jgi:FTR1 family protein
MDDKGRSSDMAVDTATNYAANPHGPVAMIDERSESDVAQGPLWSCLRHRLRRAMSDYSLFTVCFFTVLREGLESVIFLFGVGNASPSAIPISGLIGILCGLTVGMVIYYSGRQV